MTLLYRCEEASKKKKKKRENKTIEDEIGDPGIGCGAWRKTKAVNYCLRVRSESTMRVK